MAKNNDSTVYQLKNGRWAYRFSISVDGQKIARRGRTDLDGNPLLTRAEALKARKKAIRMAQLAPLVPPQSPAPVKKTMLAYAEEHGEVRPYRVDRMEGVKVLTGVGRQGREAFAKIDLAQYQKYAFSMFSDNVQPVTMVFHNRLMNAVIDRFGREVMAMKEDEDHFRVTVNVAVSHQFYGWVFGLGNLARIVGPEHVKQGMKELLENAHKKYDLNRKPAGHPQAVL